MVLKFPTPAVELNKSYPVIKALIVEDEIKSMNNLKNLLANHCPEVQVVADALNVEEALDLFDSTDFKPDVAFLAVDLANAVAAQVPQFGVDVRPGFDPVFRKDRPARH